MQHPGVPARLKVLPVFAFVYLIFPRDVLFDFRSFGFMDDFVVVSILCGIFITKGWQHVARYEKGKSDSIDVDFQVLVREEKSPRNEGPDDRSAEHGSRSGPPGDAEPESNNTEEDDTPDKDLRSRE